MMNELVSVPQVSGPRAAVLEFRGQGGEYFRIWIVNLLLKIVTLGIYSAWAKVRAKRYFYGSTLLESTAFEYHAAPWQILKGRLIAAALIVIYSLASHFVPWVAVGIAILYAIALPWVVNMGLRFNARMSSYRNVRFDFIGSYWRAFTVLVLLPIAAAATLGTLAPVAHRATARYLTSCYRFGGRPFATEPGLGRFYLVYLQALGLFLLTLLVLFGLIFVGVMVLGIFMTKGGWEPNPLEWKDDPGMQIALSLVPASFMVAIYVVLLGFVRAKTRNLVFGAATLDSRHRFASSLSPWALVWIYASNLFAIIGTLGLFTPWAQLRVARYYAERTAVYPASDLAEFLSTLPASTQAFGSEFSDLVGLEVGI